MPLRYFAILGIFATLLIPYSNIAFGNAEKYQVNYNCNFRALDGEWTVYNLKFNVIKFHLEQIVLENPEISKNRVQDLLYAHYDLALWYKLRECFETYGINPDVDFKPSPTMVEYLDISVNESNLYTIPEWVKSQIEKWNNGVVDDYHFIDVLLFLSKTELWNDSLPLQSTEGNLYQIPSWTKILSESLMNDSISDTEYVSALYFLVKQDIIRV